MSITSLNPIFKQPLEKLAIGINFANMVQVGEIISNPVMSVTPSGELSTTIISSTGNIVYFWAESGIHGTDYRIDTLVDSNGGEKLEYDVMLRIRER